MQNTALVAALLLAATAPAQRRVPVAAPIDLAHAWAHDAARDRLVVLGTDGETFELVDFALRRRADAGGTGPGPRNGASMVFDPTRGRALLFGGQLLSRLGDTWSWDGAAWRQETSGPPARSFAGMAFDSARGRAVLFGGQGNGTVLTDTWEHDGTSWLLRQPATVPPAPNAPVMAFDSGRGVTVMTVSTGLFGAPVHTWEWNGTDWIQRTSGQPAPIGGNGATMVYDPLRARCVVLGGGSTTVSFGGTSSPGSEIWEWDGTSWTLATTLGAPLRRFTPAWFSARTGAVEVFGGPETTGNGLDLASWRWNGAALQRLSGELLPARRHSHAWLPEIRGGGILFGGRQGLGIPDDTWRWDGHRWSRLLPTPAPPGRTEPATAFDLLGSRSLLFGGGVGAQVLDDFWAWTGTAWARLPNGPPGRYGAGLASDLLRGEVVLFGGATTGLFQAGALLDDTWVFDGTAWSQRFPTARPGGRHAPAMEQDLSTGNVVLFGGRTGTTAADQLADTWLWNGVQWSPRATPTTPPALMMPSLVFAWERSRLQLLGSEWRGQGQDIDEQLWEFTGSDWALRGTALLGGASGGLAILDQQRGTVVVADGGNVREWTEVAAAASSAGAGCGQAPPRLTARARPRRGEPESGLELFTAPQQPVLFAADGATGSIPVGNGCTLLLGGLTFLHFALTDGRGLAEVRWPVPREVEWRGLVLHAQAAVLDPAQPGGLALSRRLDLTVGD
ncbi:MAG: hypothetical protein AB7O97_15525 [Planctomycetota bacterium]